MSFHVMSLTPAPPQRLRVRPELAKLERKWGGGRPRARSSGVADPTAAATPAGAGPSVVAASDIELLEKALMGQLFTWRRNVSQARNVPPYRIISNKAVGAQGRDVVDILKD